jgi:excisionase family DNA binding protein
MEELMPPLADEYVTMTEAQEILGVSRFKIWQLVKDGRLPTFQSELDRRQKLIRRADLDALRKPRRLEAQGKAAPVTA